VRSENEEDAKTHLSRRSGGMFSEAYIIFLDRQGCGEITNKMFAAKYHKEP